MYHAICPHCLTEFDCECDWDRGRCPNPYCEAEYYWDEIVAEDYSDSWAVIEWDNYP